MKPIRAMARCALLNSTLALLLATSVAQAGDQPLDEIFEQWEPQKVEMVDYHSFGTLAPREGQAAMRAISFSTSQPFADLWKHYAARCGINREFVEGNTYVLSGTNSLGSYLLVERCASPKIRESLFGLRTERYSVSVTLRNTNEVRNRPTAGTIVVSLVR